MRHATEALRIAEGADHPFTLVEALTALGGVYVAQGDLGRAIGALERGLTLVREWKLQPWAALSRLGYAYALSGRLPEARRLLEEVARSTTTMSSMGVGRAIQLAWLAEACLLDQQIEVALERAQQAVSLAQSHEERGHEAWSHRLLGEIASRRDLPDAQAAEDHYHRALTLATELEMRPLTAHCHLGLGTLYRRIGKRQEAHERVSHHRDGGVPRDGHALLAGAGGSGDEGAGMKRLGLTVPLLALFAACSMTFGEPRCGTSSALTSLGRHEDHRPQDRERVPHRQRCRPPEGQLEARGRIFGQSSPPFA